MGDQQEIIDSFEALDGYAQFRNAIQAVAEERGEYAGIPMPLETNKLVVEPTFNKAIELMEMYGNEEEEKRVAEEHRDANFVNSWWCAERQREVVVYEEHGRHKCFKKPSPHNFDQQFNTLLASDAWGIEQEGAAIQLLCELITHRQFKQYALTGMFLETSKRSNVGYIFRRLRPTVALSMRSTEDHIKILCTLCLHPIAYYENSWAGAMCPTDDVIAHLMLMRGDEHMFWKRANQHSPSNPLSGI